MGTRRSSGEGSIVKRRDGLWQGSLQVNGRRYYVYGKTRKEAAAKLEVLKRQVVRWPAATGWPRKTVNELLDAWLDGIESTVKRSTLDHYTIVSDLHIRPTLGDTYLARVTPDQLQRLYASLREQGKGRTAEVVHALLRMCFDLAVRWRWIGENPCDLVRSPTHRPKPKAMWSQEQLQEFLDGTIEHWLNPVWCMAACTGCRIGEILALRWSDIDLEQSTATINRTLARIDGKWVLEAPKTRSANRTLTLPIEAIAALGRQKIRQRKRSLMDGDAWIDADLVFTGRTGGPIHRATVSHAMRRECERLGLPALTPHGLRHLHASLLLNHGLPLPTVSQRLGHATPSMTLSVYAHVLNGGDIQASQARDSFLAN